MTDAGAPEDSGLIVGTAGHVDHGKTTLVKALTGVQTDRWEEERARGLTIDLGFARMALGEGRVAGVVDVPGHEDFVKNMLAGATGVDLLLLTVAADEGPMPQTREHLDIAALLGVRRGVVALTKVDRVEEDWIGLAREAVEEALGATPGIEAAEWPIVPVSAPAGRGVEEVREALAREADGVERRPLGDHFRMPVDRSFTLRGSGTVVTGTVWSGRIARDETVRILPGNEESRVRSVEVHGEPRESAEAGHRCGLALVGVSMDEVPRGRTLVDDGSWKPTRSLGVRLLLLPHGERIVEQGQRVRIYLGTREVMARVRLAGRVALAPGEEEWARLELEDPLVARAGDRFVLRFYSPVRTLGGGRVAEMDAPTDHGGRVDLWAHLLEGSPDQAALAAVRLAGREGVQPERLPVLTGRRRDALSLADPPEQVVVTGGRWFAAEELETAEEEAVTALEGIHRRRPRAPAASLQALRSSLDDVHPALVDRALEELEAEGAIEVSGGEVRRPEHTPRLSERERQCRDRILEAIREGTTEPPTVDELSGRVGGDRDLLNDLLELLLRDGEVVRISPDLYVDPGVERELREAARDLVRESSPVAAGDFRSAVGDLTRDYLIAYLEYFDRTGLTRRTEEGRVAAGADGDSI